MKKSFAISLIAIAATTTLFYACDKNKNEHIEDNEIPDISIVNPGSGDIFAVGDTILLQADIEDASEIEDIGAYIIYNSDTIKIWPDAPSTFGNVKEYSIYAIEMDTIHMNTDAVIHYTAVDKHGNAAAADVSVQLTL